MQFRARPYNPMPFRFIRAVMFEEDIQPQNTLGVLLGLSSDYITSFEVIADHDELTLQIACPEIFLNILMGLLYTQYPKSQFEILDEDMLGGVIPRYIWSYGLADSHLFPLRDALQGEDLLAYLAGVMEVLRPQEVAIFQILVTKCRGDWTTNLKQAVMDEVTGFPREAEIDLRAIANEKAQEPFFAVQIRTAGSSAEAMYRLHRYLELFSTEFQRFIPIEEGGHLWERVLGRLSYRYGALLNPTELTGLVHLPTAKVVSDKLKRVKIPQVGAPRDLDEGVLIGANRYRNQEIPIRISDVRLNRHMLIAGATRMGKSTLGTHPIRDVMDRGKGISTFDPKGSLARTVLRLVPENRVEDVIYFRPNDRDYPFALNIFQLGKHRPRSDVIQDFIMLVDKTTFYRGDPLTARMIRILRNAMLVFFEIEGATLRDITRFLDDKEIRKKTLSQLDPEKNRHLIRFWRSIDERIDPRLRYDVSAEGVINRLDQFVGDELIGRMLCQKECKLDFEDIVTNNRILIVDLSDIGQERRAILGRMLVTELELSAMNRPVEKRSDFYIFLDELQEYLTPAITDILSMGAEYGISLIMAHQNMAQIPAEIRSSIFGNVGTIVSFRLGAEYASLMSRQYGEKFEAKHFTQLPPYETLAKTNGDAFTMSALPPEWKGEAFEMPDFSQEIIKRCRAKYATPVEEVEAEWRMDVPKVEKVRKPPEEQLNIQGNLSSEEKQKLFKEIVGELTKSG